MRCFVVAGILLSVVRSLCNSRASWTFWVPHPYLRKGWSYRALKLCTKEDYIKSGQRDDKSPVKGAWFCSRDPFLPRKARYMPSSGVCLCLCVSVTLRYCIKTAKRRITQTTPHDSSFLTPKIMAKFERDQPLRGRQVQVGWVKIGHFRRKTSYNSKTLQDRRIVSIKVE